LGELYTIFCSKPEIIQEEEKERKKKKTRQGQNFLSCPHFI